MTDGDNWLKFTKNIFFTVFRDEENGFIFYPILSNDIWKDLEVEVSLCREEWVEMLLMLYVVNVGGDCYGPMLPFLMTGSMTKTKRYLLNGGLLQLVT